MRIYFYPPFKPLGHANPSGDLIIATGLADFLAGRGHDVVPVQSVRSRWIYWKPQTWPRIAADRARLRRSVRRDMPDLWLTYHTYYKAPDVIGPGVCMRAGLPYVIFQGMYSTKRRRDVRTLAGYWLNKKALLSADHVFTNRRDDLTNLRRIIPGDKLTYAAPGVFPDDFPFSEDGREEWRKNWGVGDAPVVVTAAMFRPGVKSRGLEWTIRACGRLLSQGRNLYLAVAGDGLERPRLEALARQELGRPNPPGRQGAARPDTSFLQRRRCLRLPRLSGVPGYGLPGSPELRPCPWWPCATGGVPEVTVEGATALLASVDDFDGFSDNIGRLLQDLNLRRAMGRQAAGHVRRKHDLGVNYRLVDEKLRRVAERRAA